jgi:hypothetical protein
MQVAVCRHIKTNGLQCHGAALTDSAFCYFHRRLHNSHAEYRYKLAGRRDLAGAGTIIELPALEDRESVQLALSKVINALACNAIETKRATILLYGLQLASANAKGLQIVADPAEVVREVHFLIGEPGSSSPDIAAPGRTCEIEDTQVLKPGAARRRTRAACRRTGAACRRNRLVAPAPVRNPGNRRSRHPAIPNDPAPRRPIPTTGPAATQTGTRTQPHAPRHRSRSLTSRLPERPQPCRSPPIPQGPRRPTGICSHTRANLQSTKPPSIPYPTNNEQRNTNNESQ